MQWSAIEALYEKDVQQHWQSSTAKGLNCPFDVFEQLFHDHHGHEDFTRDLIHLDWRRVVWEDAQLSGVGLRRVAAPRGYQYAVDEARARTLEYGLQDEREDVLTSWRDAGTWVRRPVLLEGRVLGNSLEHELLVGFTRLGDLYGMLDRGQVPEAQRHSVWIGRRRVD